MDQPGKVANPARGQLNRESNIILLSPCVPENLVSRDGFSRPVPRQPAHLHTQAESGAYLRDSSRSTLLYSCTAVYTPTHPLQYYNYISTIAEHSLCNSILLLPCLMMYCTNLSSLFFWCPCMAINVTVQYNGGFLPDIILLTQGYYHRGTRLNAMTRFCICSL